MCRSNALLWVLREEGGGTGLHLHKIRNSIEFFYNSTFPGKSWQDPASIDIQWVATIVCQCWQDPAMMCQEITNYRKTQFLSKFSSVRQEMVLVLFSMARSTPVADLGFS